MLRVLFHCAPHPARPRRPTASPIRLIVLAWLCGNAGLSSAAAPLAGAPVEAATHTARGPAESETTTGYAPLGRYQRWRDEAPDDWRRANERVGAIGGWRGYAREIEDGTDALGAEHADERGADQGGKHGH